MYNEANKKFCHKCGAQLDAQASFCTSCGEPCDLPQGNVPTVIDQYNQNLAAKPKAKIDLRGTVLNNLAPIICLAIGIVLLIAGLRVSVPSDYISSYSMKEYVGGDAYNFIIEASLRGGRIAGALITKCVYIAVGLLISCMAAMKITLVKPEGEKEA